MNNIEKPTPLNRKDFTSKLIDPYLGEDTKPSPPDKLNRGEQVSLRDDKNKLPIVGLEDHDKAIQYYFDNVIKPAIIQNGQRIVVPVIISSPEKFKSVQTDGFFRDKNGKIMLPLITYKRESFEKNRDLGNKLDGNLVHNIQVFEQHYSKRNVYDNFGILTNTKPQVSKIITVVPDYVTITYSCIVFTNYIEQNNKLIESIQFASDSYWGNPNEFSFRARIDTFNTTTILEQDSDRAIKSTFNIILNGYLIPNTINKDLAIIQNKIFDKSKVVFKAKIIGESARARRVNVSSSLVPTADNIFITVDNTNLTSDLI